MESEPSGFSPEYTESLIELSRISGHFTGPDEDLERSLHAIGAMSFSIPDVIDGTKNRLVVSVTASTVRFTRTLPSLKPNLFWMTKEAIDGYEFVNDGTVLNQAAPEGKGLELLGQPVYPIERTLRSGEDLSTLLAKLRIVREYLDSLPPMDWSQNRSITLPL